jgi:hypothetical protein
MRKDLTIIYIATLIVLAGCNGPSGGNNTNEVEYEYYYRVEITEGYQAEILHFSHEDPGAARVSSGWVERQEGLWESEMFLASIKSPTPFAELRARRIQSIDPLDEGEGQIVAQIIVDGVVVEETKLDLPVGNTSFSIEYDFTEN